MPTISFSYAGTATQSIVLAAGATAKEQTAAIQSALDAVAGHSGATVTLSAGTFTVVGNGIASEGILRVHDDTTLLGAGIGQTVIKLADGATGVTGIVRTASGTILPDGSAATTTNVLIGSLSIDGNASQTTGATDGFYCGPQPGTALHDGNITVDRVEIMNVSRYGFDPHEQTVGLTISNSLAHHNGVDGFVADFCSNVTFVNDESYANGRHGMNIVTSSSNVAIINAVLHDNGACGIVVQTGDNEIRAFTSGVTISGGMIAGNRNAGIDVHQATDVAIDKVNLDSNGMAGVSLAGVERVTLTGNTFTGAISSSDTVKIVGYLQDFADTDQGNDRFIATHAVTVDGTLLADPTLPADVTLWNYNVTVGDDIVAIDETTTDGNSRDAIAAGSGNDTVSGGRGTDTLTGEDGNDVLNGNDGNDNLNGGAGNDSLFGGAGDDTLLYTGGVDILDGGAGADIVDFSRAGSGLYINLRATSGYEVWTSGTWISTAANAMTPIADLANIEWISGSSHSDTFVGSTVGDRFDGNAGDDVVFADGAADTVSGGDGNDTLVGNADIFAQEADSLSGGNGNDVIYGEFTDAIDGGAGFDILYAVNAYDWTINLGDASIELFFSDFGNDTIDATMLKSGVEVVASGGDDSVTGSAFADRLWGGSGADTLNGGEGDDMLFGDVGGDQMRGGGGNDILYADASDTIDGGAGFDVVYMTAGTGAHLDMAATGIEFLIDQAGGNNVIDASGMSIGASIYTGAGTDAITGSGFDDVLWGMGGSDTITAGAGADVLIGGIGADVLNGGSGVDRIYLNSGGGGDGAADRVLLAAGWGSDTAYDFEHGIDKIDMTKLGTSFGALTISSTADGAALVTLGADQLYIAGLAGQLNAADFTF